MIIKVKLRDSFRNFCADGNAAAKFRFERIDPYVDSAEQVILDFDGVRSMNSSFCNALIATLVSQTGPTIMTKLRFVNCHPNVQGMIRSAIRTGLIRLQEKNPQTHGNPAL